MTRRTNTFESVSFLLRKRTGFYDREESCTLPRSPLSDLREGGPRIVREATSKRVELCLSARFSDESRQLKPTGVRRLVPIARNLVEDEPCKRILVESISVIA